MNWKKIMGIMGLLVLSILLMLHFWITYHAEFLLKKFITSQSKGTLVFNSDKARVNYVLGRVEFTNTSIHSLAKGFEKKNSYDIRCKKLVLQLKDVFPLITGKHLSIDSVIVESPEILLIKNEAGAVKQINLAAEWATVYNSIINTVNLFFISKLHITDASFRLEDAINPANKPLELSGINLLVNQLYLGKKNIDIPAVSVKEIELTLGRENIIIPGGKSEIGFKKFSLNTATGLIMLDSCSVVARSASDSSRINIFTDSLSIQQMDFAQLYQTGNISAAKILLSKPLVQLFLHPKADNKNIQKKSLKELIKGFNTGLSVNELIVNNASTDITTQLAGKINHFAIDEVNFYVNKLLIDPSIANSEPLSYDSIDLSIRNYGVVTADSAFVFKSGLFHIVNGQVEIKDLLISPNKKHNNTILKIAEVKRIQIDDLSVNDLLFYKVLSAKSIRLYEPAISLVNQYPASSKKAKFNAAGDLDKLLKIDQLFLINGQLNYTDNNQTIVLIKQVNGTASLAGILTSTSARDLLTKMQQIGIGEGSLQLPSGTMRFQHAALIPGTNGLTIKKALLTLLNPSVKASLENIRATVDLSGTSKQSMHIKYAGWGSGVISIVMNAGRYAKVTGKRPLNLIVEKMKMENTRLEYINGKQSIRSFVKSATVSDLKIVPDEKLQLKKIFLFAQETSFHDNMIDLSAQSIRIPAIGQVDLSGIKFQHTGTSLDINATVPSFQLQGDLNRLFAGDFNFDKVSLDRPTFSILSKVKSENEPVTEKAIEIPDFGIKALTIKNASGTIISTNHKQPFSLEVNDLSTTATGIGTSAGRISIDSNELTADNIIFTRDATPFFKGGIGFRGSNFFMNDSSWNYFCDEASAKNITLNLLNKDSTEIVAKAGKMVLNKLILNAANTKNIRTIAGDNGSAGLGISDVEIQLPGELLKISNIAATHINEDIGFDSIAVNAVLSRENFIEQSPWQTDDIRVFAGRLNLKGWRPGLFVKDSIISFRNVEVTDPFFDVYRDKNKPEQHGIIKLLPTLSLQAVPVNFIIDTARINNGHIIYLEKNKSTQLTAKVEFTGLRARLTNVKNTGLSDTDSLRLIASAKFMDQAMVKVRIDESYKDSLAGFLLAASLSPTRLDILNDVTQAAASVQIKSGYADTMYMYAIAREYISLGKMFLPYSKLKIRFLKKGVEDDKYFLGGLVTFAANTFIIKRNNKNRKGIIYFPRLREKGVFNYLAKMFMSGASSSAGAKSNRNYLRKYKKALKEKQLPPVRSIDE